MFQQLEQMIKQCNAGKPVNLDEMPPEVATGSSSTPQTVPEPSPAPTETQQPMAEGRYILI